jgi:hypothetical protein
MFVASLVVPILKNTNAVRILVADDAAVISGFVTPASSHGRRRRNRAGRGSGYRKSAGICSALLPLTQIGAMVRKMAGRT